MEVVVVSQGGEVGVRLDKFVVLLELLVSELFCQMTGWLLFRSFGLLAHQDLLELFRQDVNVARKKREEV